MKFALQARGFSSMIEKKPAAAGERRYPMGKEIECKLHVPKPERLDAILADPAVSALWLSPPVPIRMETSYFDTEAGILRSQKWTLRSRKENDKTVITCKTASLPEQPMARGEWSIEGEGWLTDSVPSPAALKALVGQGAPPQLLTILGNAPLVLYCSAAFTRRCCILRFPDGCMAELAADCGELHGGSCTEPLCELELELQAGDVQTMLAFGQQLAQQYGLHEEHRSKFIRAAALNHLAP